MSRSASSTNGEILAASLSLSWPSTSTLRVSPLCFPAHPPKRNRQGSAGLDWLPIVSPIDPNDDSRGARKPSMGAVGGLKRAARQGTSQDAANLLAPPTGAMTATPAKTPAAYIWNRVSRVPD